MTTTMPMSTLLFRRARHLAASLLVYLIFVLGIAASGGAVGRLFSGEAVGLPMLAWFLFGFGLALSAALKLCFADKRELAYQCDASKA
uniref:hypothetical protein n=1 Tax=Cupriavidus gilardii TaxID=82541 RepID=UPI002478F15A|nr:hypothetical protein [Cupriavidus gilardii]